MKIEIGQHWLENDNRFYRVVKVTKIGDGEKAGKVQMNGSNRCWVSISRLSMDGKRAGYSPAKECGDCTKGTPTETRKWFRQNCPTCKATGWVKASVPNSEIRQAGPETHDKQEQRNPALPASNG